MIVRESPKAGAKKPSQSWPPKSPHEALLSSPSGRRKYERRLDRNSVSPSPTKRRPMARGQSEDDDEDDDEEDEETLELQLQAIEARLKLKKLQKARKAADDGEEDENVRASSRPNTATGSRRVDLPRPHSQVEVPVSPTRNRRAPEEPKSPARVLLGIDKGLRAQDVSLKRPASAFSKGNVASLSRSNSTRGTADAPRAKSFSERIAETRNKDREKEEKRTRIEKSRSRGFGLSSIGNLGDDDSSRAGSSLSSGTRNSRDTAPPNREPANLPKSRSINELRAGSTPRPSSNHSFRSDLSRASAASARTSSTLGSAATSANGNSSEPSIFESYSGMHLKSRTMPHGNVARTLDGKTIYTIPQLLKIVKSPEYDPPDVEGDFVVMGVIASKSSPLTTKNARREQTAGNQETDVNQPGKFMVIKLTDLKWELDLFLFDTGFSQFWKLSVGTLIAILNPDIMPPKTRDSGKFSLKLTSSDDTVLEIGTARDLDFCHAMRKDGKECGQWIDGRKTEFCDFHVELQVEKSKRGRMEVNTMGGFGKGPSGGKFGMFGGGGPRGGAKDDGLRREGMFRDRSIHETVFIAPGAGAAARLLDADEGMDRATRAELHRKRLAEKERERELANKLGNMGRGAGSDYMRVKGAAHSNVPARGAPTPADASSTATEKPNALDDPLGLIGKKADDVSLAPVKRKRIASGKSTASNEPVGWSGAFKRGVLLSPKKESNLRPSSRDARENSPAKKRARLLLPEKGIREPGRDSLGGLDVGLIAAMDEDEDDLEVV